MAIDFPNSPTANQTYTVGGKTWTYSVVTYAIGDTGPAGGKIFITPSTAGNSTGKYFEAAPYLNPDVTRTWSTGANQTALVSGADGSAIGTGEQNTLDIVAQSGNVAATCAAAYANDYTSGSYSDWFLPSGNELNEMYTQRTLIGGYNSARYWTSTESSSTEAYVTTFMYSSYGTLGKSSTTNAVRPVRSFAVEGGRWVVVDKVNNASNQVYDVTVLLRMETN